MLVILYCFVFHRGEGERELTHETKLIMKLWFLVVSHCCFDVETRAVSLARVSWLGDRPFVREVRLWSCPLTVSGDSVVMAQNCYQRWMPRIFFVRSRLFIFVQLFCFSVRITTIVFIRFTPIGHPPILKASNFQFRDLPLVPWHGVDVAWRRACTSNNSMNVSIRGAWRWHARRRLRA